MARHNDLHHGKTLSSHRTEASYSRSEKRWCGGGKAARIASRRYNKACRAASKLQLSRYHKALADEEVRTSEEVPDPNWADELAEEYREQYWADPRFNDYCEEYDEVMQVPA